MNERLTQSFKQNEGVFMPFLMIGDPDEATSHALVDAVIKGGTDLLEFGLPFSDPPADGPSIQAAGLRALRSGMNTGKALAFISQVRDRTTVPIALLLYYNLIFKYGVDRFFAEAGAAGVDAVLIADLPIEEAAGAIRAAKQNGIAPIFIVSEVTSPERLAHILQQAEGYLYVVARLGVTGEKGDLNPALGGLLASLREKTDLPLLVGFGISTPDQARQVIAAGAHGVICGSAIANRIAAHLDAPEKMCSIVEGFCHEMQRASRVSGIS